MITVQSLSKSYGPNKVLMDVSFTVEQGKITGFLGPNGAGKTTTMRAILGLEQPDAGSTSIDGTPYPQLSNPFRTVGSLLDTRWLIPGLSIQQQAEVVAKSLGVSSANVKTMLEEVGLGSVPRRRVRELSLGMRQRLGLGLALLGRPTNYIFDEPINGLDPDGIIWFRELAQKLASEGSAILLSSHLMSEMELTADRIVILHQGRILTDTDLSGLQKLARSKVIVRANDPRSLAAAFPGDLVEHLPNTNDGLAIYDTSTREVFTKARDAGVLLDELRNERVSLESVYRQMTQHTNAREDVASHV